ncbi:hypothetical protein BN946_scf184815.g36 [Trametes cinnabarina]|uniref:FAD-binding domain-containing protein n=1 Tax=Pycnoporus cinnabarinus TaxID=5643 RepID=A0A060S7Z7_PYCCI|nr:hypothetical protein BN946_scf184815.g36 [Trametes cinnabarina]
MEESKVDVLIIGAGPAGLMCANALAHAGIPVRVIDKSPKGGIERLRRMPAITAPSTARYPFTCTLHQGAIEAIFHDDMKTVGLGIDRPTIPISIELSEDEAELSDPQAYPVKVVVQHLDRNDIEVIRAKFVLGSDGAHSWVRKAMDIKMEGDMSDFIWGVVDIIPDTDYPDTRNLAVIHSPEGSALLIPREGGLLRLYVQLADADVIDPQTGRLDKARTSPQKVLEMAKRILRPYRMDPIGEIRWWTTYIGQGMNASMADTHNLAWKLAYVLRGWADISLLKTYEFERRKFAVDLINFDRQWAALFSSGKAGLKGTNDTLHDMFRRNGQFTSGIGVRNLIVGERMLPHVFICASDARPVNIHDMLPADTRFKVLVFVGDIVDEEVAERVGRLGEELAAPDSFLNRYGHGGSSRVFDVICISASSKQDVDWTDFPKVLSRHWSKVLLDDEDMHGRSGGGGFVAYGINPRLGAIVIVRPDGHVGLVLLLSWMRRAINAAQESSIRNQRPPGIGGAIPTVPAGKGSVGAVTFSPARPTVNTTSAQSSEDHPAGQRGECQESSYPASMDFVQQYSMPPESVPDGQIMHPIRYEPSSSGISHAPHAIAGYGGLSTIYNDS